MSGVARRDAEGSTSGIDQQGLNSTDQSSTKDLLAGLKMPTENELDGDETDDDVADFDDDEMDDDEMDGNESPPPASQRDQKGRFTNSNLSGIYCTF